MALPLEVARSSNQSDITGTRVAKAEVIKADCPICEKILRVLRTPSNDIRTVGMVELGSGTEIIQPVPSCDRHQKLIVSVLRLDADQSDEEICTIAKCIKNWRYTKTR
ncbi:hypothetical protein Ptr902_06244 [Pyrenophora tritici-repentis]|nr:hypothetical protein Ptr902_06244 [Pyrenophora tritici-repentis]